MKYVVEVFTYGVITDRFLYSTKKEANSMYKVLLAKHQIQSARLFAFLLLV